MRSGEGAIELGGSGYSEQVGCYERLHERLQEGAATGEGAATASRLDAMHERVHWVYAEATWHYFISGPVLIPADSSSLLHANYLPLLSSQMLADTALKRAEAELSNAASTSAGKPHSGERLTFKGELESAGISCGLPTCDGIQREANGSSYFQPQACQSTK